VKLPHGKYLLFAKDLVEHTEKYIVVDCSFPMIPTLAMFLEAAAQCTVGFDREENVKMGYLTMGKDIKILNNINKKEYFFKIEKGAHVAEYHQFNFEVLCKETGVKVVSGTLTLKTEI